MDYADSFADEAYGDAILGAGYAADDSSDRPAEGNYEVEAELSPHGALSATGSVGVSTEDFADDTQDARNRNVGAGLTWSPSSLPTMP